MRINQVSPEPFHVKEGVGVRVVGRKWLQEWVGGSKSSFSTSFSLPAPSAAFWRVLSIPRPHKKNKISKRHCRGIEMDFRLTAGMLPLRTSLLVRGENLKMWCAILCNKLKFNQSTMLPNKGRFICLTVRQKARVASVLEIKELVSHRKVAQSTGQGLSGKQS